MNPPLPYEDASLARLARTGDRWAVGRLYEQHKSGLMAYCRQILGGDTSLAQDAVQETFIKAMQQGSSLTNEEAIRPWLYRIARNESLMVLRKRRPETACDPDAVWDPETPFTLLESNDTRTVIREVIASLQLEYREALLLREDDRLSYADIAMITGSTESAVKSRIFKARRALARRLEGML